MPQKTSLKLDIKLPEHPLDENLVLPEDYCQLLLENALGLLKESINKKKKKCILFEIINYDYKVVVKQNQFINILNKGIEYYEKIEDFEKCSELNKLKNKLNER